MKRREALSGLLAAGLTGAYATLWPGTAWSADRTVRVFYSADFVRSGHPFDTTRKAKWVAESLTRRPIRNVALARPRPLTEAELRKVHAPEYVTAIRTGKPAALANSPGLPWNPDVWPMVLASNGGAVEAATVALRTGCAGSLSSGIHHARRERGNGFCTFNGLVLAAGAAIAAGAKRVLVLDLDAHCGGGTYSFLDAFPEVLHVDIAVNPFDRYSPRGRHTLDLLDDSKQYLPTLQKRLASLEGEKLDLCLYNAGMDAHERSPTGGLAGMTTELLADRERQVFRWCRSRKLPISFVLAGGYTGEKLTQDELVSLHRLTLTAAAEA